MKICIVCKVWYSQSHYSMRQWFIQDSERICNLCIKKQQEHEQETAEQEGQEEDGSPPGISCIPRLHKEISQVDTLATRLSNIDMTNDTTEPHRAIDQILGELSEPTVPVICELLNALVYERSTSPIYLNALKQLTNKNCTEIPMTYETEYMISANNYFLMGHSPFSLRKHSFSDSNIGAGLLLDFKNCEDNDLHPIVYVGECHFSLEDLWYFAHIRNTKPSPKKNRHILPEHVRNIDSPRPHHHSVLLCPFCATLLDPTNHEETYIMLARMMYEFVGDMDVGYTAFHQLCCKSCFAKNLIENGEDWGEFPGCERYGLKQNLLNANMLGFTSGTPADHCMSAENMHSLTVESGLSKMWCMYLMENISANYSQESTKYKVKLSKSLSKASGWKYMKVTMTNLGKRTCFTCGVNIVNTSACSKCKNAHYCSKFCQRLHWKEHKKICNPETKVEPLPCDSILLNTNERYSIEERQNPENFCKSCKKFTGDSHGYEAYCLGCAKFLFCGPCNGSMPKNNGGEIHGGTSAMHYKGCCPDCVKHLDPDARVMYAALENLIEKNPTGIHVKHMRLCMAQFMLDEQDDLNGKPNEDGIVYAKKEIKWLANNLDYAPAQLLFASLHDPICQMTDVGVYKGPLNIQKLSKCNFYEANIAVAKKYYERACEQKLSCALVVVGLYYKDGNNQCMFEKDEAKGISMLEEAAAMGHTGAMYEVGVKYYFENINRKKGIKLLREAAFNGHYSAMFYIGMEGVEDKTLRSFGKWCVLMLLQKKIFKMEGNQQNLKDAASFYGIL
ncbi:hypothetical protein CTEN210_04199 [Chaetoceros tenuissimus]|uniref:MYND-type domain-containing protein n=1 Tax=Chaetoceros tenuissimus TaxID=426638 RepID=A0AAD3CL75_9STRA|nr:hypothetical protein CTEN210_04199 [Chaetoceros tenuissimus]